MSLEKAREKENQQLQFLTTCSDVDAIWHLYQHFSLSFQSCSLPSSGVWQPECGEPEVKLLWEIRLGKTTLKGPSSILGTIMFMFFSKIILGMIMLQSCQRKMLHIIKEVVIKENGTSDSRKMHSEGKLDVRNEVWVNPNF
ncbi:Hypothetical predicted protein [Podarcis lilfordi]|uniref:Uncharacterized protein n=1 Tax=Podarcis lilfordi TaxID=74358 RepID=A0AA35KMB1_9SAUR|nr:Hypothetical predicted protein [Podarcis lilfordi]